MKKYTSQQKKSINQQLKAYSLVAGSMVTIIGTTQAAIQYTDVDPDKTINTHLDFFSLDLNNDGVQDFKLNQLWQVTTNYTGTRKFYSAALSVQGVNGFVGTFFSSPVALDFNDQIGATQYWPFTTWGLLGSYGYDSSYSQYSGGNFLNTQSKYLGLKVVVSGKTYYGWVRLNVADKAKGFTVRGYAYQDVAGMSIKAGEGAPPTSVNDDLHPNQLSLYSYGKSIYLSSLDNKLNEATIDVFDMNGRKIYSGKFDGQSKKVNMQQAAAGQYLVLLSNNRSTIRRKVFIQ